MKALATVRKGASEIPPELQRSMPRDCEWTPFGRLAIAGTVALILGALVVGIGIYISATGGLTLRRAMQSSGQVASGVVIQNYHTKGDDKKDVFVYEFAVNGFSYRGRIQVSLKRSPHYSIGSSVPVRYLPSRPERNWIEGYPPGGVPFFLIPLISGACLVSAWFIVVTLRRQRELLSEGRPVLALVKKIERIRSGKHDGQNVQRVFLEYPLMSGALRESHVDFQRRPPAVGSATVILYDREKPESILRYPASLVRVARPPY